MLKQKVQDAARSKERLSNRDFAARIGLSSGALSEILSGNRKLSVKTAQRILERLDLPAEEKHEFLVQMSRKGTARRAPLGEGTPELVTNWLFFSALAALELEEPPATPAALAKFLGVSRAEATAALETLHENRLVDRQGANYVTIHRTLASSDDRASPAIVARHVLNMRLGMAALERVAVNDRDFTGLTFSGNSRRLGKAKKEIRKFLDKLAENMSGGGLDQVYQVNVQLFPMGNWEKPSGKD